MAMTRDAGRARHQAARRGLRAPRPARRLPLRPGDPRGAAPRRRRHRPHHRLPHAAGAGRRRRGRRAALRLGRGRLPAVRQRRSPPPPGVQAVRRGRRDRGACGRDVGAGRRGAARLLRPLAHRRDLRAVPRVRRPSVSDRHGAGRDGATSVRGDGGPTARAPPARFAGSRAPRRASSRAGGRVRGPPVRVALLRAPGHARSRRRSRTPRSSRRCGPARSSATCAASPAPGVLTEADLKELQLDGDVTEFHDMIKKLRDHYASRHLNPRESFTIGVAQSNDGKPTGVAVVSTPRPLVDDTTVRLLGRVAYALSRPARRPDAEDAERRAGRGGQAQPERPVGLPVVHLSTRRRVTGPGPAPSGTRGRSRRTAGRPESSAGRGRSARGPARARRGRARRTSR